MELSRRRLLQVPAALALTALAACRDDNKPRARATPPVSTAPTTPAAEDEPARASAVASELTLLLAYDTTLSRHPSLRTQLAPLRAHHVAHLRTFSGDDVPSPASTIEPLPRHPRGALARLARIEGATAASYAKDCLDVGADLAELLGSVAACEAAHAALLEAVSS